MPVIKLIELADGGPTPFAGQYLKAYRWKPDGVDATGEMTVGTVETTRNRADAMNFASAFEALEFWRKAYGVRPDGELNRPLAAFTVEIL